MTCSFGIFCRRMCMNSKLILVGILVVSAISFPHGDGKPGSGSVSRTELEKRLKKVSLAGKQTRNAVFSCLATWIPQIDDEDLPFLQQKQLDDSTKLLRLEKSHLEYDSWYSLHHPSIQMSIPKSERKKTRWEINQEQGVAEYLTFSSQLEALEKRILGSGTGRIRRQVVKNALLWPNATVNYIFTDNFTVAEMNIIRRGLAMISAHTCVNFVENSNSRNWVKVFRGPGCSSPIGMFEEGEQPLALNDECIDEASAMHEFIHALGSHHTQARFDRDNFITYYPNAAKPISALDYQKLLQSESVNYVPYDYGSIMHYDPFANALDENIPVLEPKQKNYFYTLGSELVSFYDLVTVNSIYQCKCGCPRTVPCYNGGYRNPRNCSECNCPAGYSGVSCDKRREPSSELAIDADLAIEARANQKTTRECVISEDKPDNGCGQTWEATPEWKTTEIEIAKYDSNLLADFLICTYWITVPEGRTLKVQLKSIQNEQCDSGCRTNGIEFKVSLDTKEVNPRVCCLEQLPQLANYSTTLNPAPVIAFSKSKEPTKFIISIRYV